MIGAVSYTHLDVYKRQVWNLSFRFINVQPPFFVYQCDSCAIIAPVFQPLQAFYENRVSTVSYTHLDVYKRQAIRQVQIVGLCRVLGRQSLDLFHHRKDSHPVSYTHLQSNRWISIYQQMYHKSLHFHTFAGTNQCQIIPMKDVYKRQIWAYKKRMHARVPSRSDRTIW